MTEQAEVEKVTMSDGRELAFGKKTAVFNVVEDGNGIRIQGAFVDGQYAEHTIESVEELHAFAVYGLKAFAKAAKLDSAAGFEGLGWANPNALAPRKSKGKQANPLEAALVEVTGKDLSTIRTFLASKSKAEKLALGKSAKVAPVLARIKAGKAKAPEVDLLAGLVDDEVPAGE